MNKSWIKEICNGRQGAKGERQGAETEDKETGARD
jgi:hypothetical protein